MASSSALPPDKTQQQTVLPASAGGSSGLPPFIALHSLGAGCAAFQPLASPAAAGTAAQRAQAQAQAYPTPATHSLLLATCHWCRRDSSASVWKRSANYRHHRHHVRFDGGGSSSSGSAGGSSTRSTILTRERRRLSCSSSTPAPGSWTRKIFPHAGQAINSPTLAVTSVW